MIDKYIIFTSHSRDRLKECQISVPKASHLIYTGFEEELPKDLKKNKQKYNEQAKYIRNGTLIFTLIDVKEKFTNDDVYLVVSVYDQRTSL